MLTCFAIGASLLSVPFLCLTLGIWIAFVSDHRRCESGISFSQVLAGICLFTPLAAGLAGLAVWFWQQALA